MSTDPIPFDPAPHIARELGLPLAGVRATTRLLAEGASVPFIARYRKEQTGNLDEVQIRAIDEKRIYDGEVHERRQTILEEVARQGKLTDDLRARVEGCWIKAELEDLYLPYRPKRRTRATIARERGLGGLAERLLEQPDIGDPQAEGAAYVDPTKEVPDVEAALAGARDIAAEAVAERADVRALVRETYLVESELVCEPVKRKTGGPTKYEAYYQFREKLRDVPSHRYLAIRRGESEGILRLRVLFDEAALVAKSSRLAGVRPGSPFAGELEKAVADGLVRLACPSLLTDVRVEKKLAADREAATVFAENLRGLLLAPPLGRSTVLGIDPGQRTGCKCAVVDDTGTLRAHALIQLVGGEAATARAQTTVMDLISAWKPQAIAVGNGTHGRETADFCRELLRDLGKLEGLPVVLVSEAGASVYSASDLAREEFPSLDLTVRGAISIARRLQDPLAELVKIDPKAIGVGQYQHDVHPPLLERKLDEVVESCVNGVGVELNTASAPLLERVAGVGPALARNIVKRREAKGAFASRAELLEVPGLGPKSYEQCAGFVRVRDGSHPLDRSAVHPERYLLVEQITQEAGLSLGDLVGNEAAVAAIDWSRYVSAEVGEPTLADIRAELLRPGRDPRDRFEPPRFRDDVRRLDDLAVGMALEGIVTNVTAFGAFVDVGVHQDGLVHISQLADRFVRDPHEVVKVGTKLTVRVLEVDLARKRVALTARSSEPVARRQPGAGEARAARPPDERKGRRSEKRNGRPSEKREESPAAKAVAKRDAAPAARPRDARPSAKREATPVAKREAKHGDKRMDKAPSSSRGNSGFTNRPFERLLEHLAPKR